MVHTIYAMINRFSYATENMAGESLVRNTHFNPLNAKPVITALRTKRKNIGYYVAKVL